MKYLVTLNYNKEIYKFHKCAESEEQAKVFAIHSLEDILKKRFNSLINCFKGQNIEAVMLKGEL
jgi:hypothetical protein